MPAAKNARFAIQVTGGARCLERRQARLEVDLCGKLNLALSSLKGRFRSCRGVGSNGRCVRGCGRIIELRRAGEVEGFRAQLKNLRFGQVGILEDRKVHGLCARTLKNIAAGVFPRSRGGNRESRNVEPLPKRALTFWQRSVAEAGKQLRGASVHRPMRCPKRRKTADHRRTAQWRSTAIHAQAVPAPRDP